MASGPLRRQGHGTARKEAEAKFKALGEALGVLTRKPLHAQELWDEGHDHESIAQHVQRCDQQAGYVLSQPW